MAFGPSLSWQAADGTGHMEVLAADEARYPQAFTPDGAALVFEQRSFGGGSAGIGVLRLDGERTATMLLEAEFSERNAALSHDGRWLAYESDESGRYEVYVRPFPDVDAGRWQISTAGGLWPVWSPVGGELFFRGPTGVVAHAYTTEPTFTLGAGTELFEWTFFRQGTNRRMAVSPDSKRFLLLKLANADTADAQRAQVILVQNWLEELKARVPN